MHGDRPWPGGAWSRRCGGGTTQFTSPLLSSIVGKNGKSNGTDIVTSNSTTVFARNRSSKPLVRRDECRTIHIKYPDDCGELAQRWEISGDEFTRLNSDPDFCSNLVLGKHVCCSSGDLPNYLPKPNDDGSCATAVVGKGEFCATIAAANGFTVDELKEFNQDTWRWHGCDDLWKFSVICISKGSPPVPAPMANAVCGPQFPSTEESKDKRNIASLNACPLMPAAIFGVNVERRPTFAWTPEELGPRHRKAQHQRQHLQLRHYNCQGRSGLRISIYCLFRRIQWAALVFGSRRVPD